MARVGPAVGPERPLTRGSFPAPFVSLAVKGSKLETEMMEGMASGLPASVGGNSGWCLPTRAGWGGAGRKGLGASDSRSHRTGDTEACYNRWVTWSARDPEGRCRR